MDPQSQLHRHRALLGVAHDLSRSENVEQLLDQILECSREVMDCDICSILLPEASSGDLIIRSPNDKPGQEPIRIPRGKGIASRVFESKEVVNIVDARTDPRHFSEASFGAGLDFRAMLTVPLLDGDRALGVLQGINPQDRDSFDEHDVAMFETFASLISVTLIRLEASRNAIVEAERNQQLELANEIQLSFLPDRSAKFGQIDIHSFYQPASEVGGDFYFWHPLDEDCVLLGVADVCGKGFPAALDMARCSTLIASLSHLANQMSLSEWVGKLNSRLCDVMRQGRFIAGTFLLIDQRQRKVEICVCGCLPPKILSRQDWIETGITPNPPLGITCSFEYLEHTVPLGLGQKWLVMTDGILETQGEQGARFEDQAFDEVLQAIAHEPGADVLDRITTAWEEFSVGATYQDDTTLLTFEDQVEPPPAAFFFTCRPEVLKEARDYVEAWCEFAGLEEKATGLVVLGCDEVFSNICKHAYCQTGPAQCQMFLSPDGLNVLIEHQGDGIDNAELPAECETPGDQAGGRGLFLIQQVFDEVDFSNSPEVAQIRLLKKLYSTPGIES